MDTFQAKAIRLKLEAEIEGAIGKVCEEEGYQVSYAVINAALLHILINNNQQETKEL